MSGSPFDPLVDWYDAARPTYPAVLYDWLEAEHPLEGALVVEVGAGTGIATRGLLARGADVVPVDIGAAVLRRLKERSPGQAAVVGSGEALPVRDGVADLVCAAQCWHWLDDARAAGEAIRVLRPGGVLAVWWNDVAAEGESWYAAQQARLAAMNPDFAPAYRHRPTPDPIESLGIFASVQIRTAQWQRTLSLDEYDAWLRSKSYVAALGVREEEFLRAERASLSAAFPDGVVVEPFEVKLVVARTATAAG